MKEKLIQFIDRNKFLMIVLFIFAIFLFIMINIIRQPPQDNTSAPTNISSVMSGLGRIDIVCLQGIEYYYIQDNNRLGIAPVFDENSKVKICQKDRPLLEDTVNVH